MSLYSSCVGPRQVVATAVVFVLFLTSSVSFAYTSTTYGADQCIPGSGGYQGADDNFITYNWPGTSITNTSTTNNATVVCPMPKTTSGPGSPTGHQILRMRLTTH